MKQKTIRIGHKQDGYIIIITVVLLAALLASTLGFFERATRNMKTTIYNRDSAESLLLAESAMNSLMGRFLVEDVDQRNGIDGDEMLDVDAIFAAAIANTPSPLAYLYFVSQSGLEIDQEKPSVLQRIANGEAIGQGSELNSKLINADQNNLLISNLFVANQIHPMIFTYDAQNLLEFSYVNGNPANWNTLLENNEKIALAWFELVKNPNLAGSYQIYVGAIGMVGVTGTNGKSKSYVQRLYGTVNATLGNLAVMNQDS